MDILQFIFSGFWTFIGSVILLSIIGKIIIGLVAVFFAKGNVNIN